MDERAIEQMQREWEDRQVQRQASILESKADYIADTAWVCWSKGELRFFLTESPVWLDYQHMKLTHPEMYARMTRACTFGRFNGYVRFPKLPVVAPGIRGILSYVPVHGGITFCQQWWDDSVTYGFDTGHAISSDNREIIDDMEWMMTEAESLARGIQIAARFERFYLNAGDDIKRKARVLDRMGRFLPLEDLTMSVMLNLLAGEL
jgi:hypothetical protein